MSVVVPSINFQAKTWCPFFVSLCYVLVLSLIIALIVIERITNHDDSF
jgi:hypothetical protein